MRKQCLNLFHLLLGGVVGISEAALDITIHEVSGLRSVELYSAKCVLKDVEDAFKLSVIKSILRNGFHELQFGDHTGDRSLVGFPLLELLAECLSADVKDLFVFANLIETRNDLDGFSVVVAAEFLPCSREVVLPFLNLFAVLLVYFLNTPHEVRSCHSVLLLKHIFKFFVV